MVTTDVLIGYRVYNPKALGMHEYLSSSRAWVVQVNGVGTRELTPELCANPDCWTDFTGWSPDGRFAVIGAGWEDPVNAAWEEAHSEFRLTQGWRYDQYLLDMTTGVLTNLTAVERVSDYNSGLFFWPGDPARLGFQALIDGQMTPFSMALDGSGKSDLSRGMREFTYGFSASPDGACIAYHKNYQVYLANGDGSDPQCLDTGNPFNFCPSWSPDGQWVLFVSGEHYDCHPHVVQRDGSGLRKLADRRGYRGVTEMLETPAFHSESSDIPTWSADGAWIYFTARIGEGIELLRVSLAGEEQQLTASPPGTCYYHPKPSPDGSSLLIGSNRDGGHLLYLADADGGNMRLLTSVSEGFGTAHGVWQPISGM